MAHHGFGRRASDVSLQQRLFATAIHRLLQPFLSLSGWGLPNKVHPPLKPSRKKQKCDFRCSLVKERHSSPPHRRFHEHHKTQDLMLRN